MLNLPILRPYLAVSVGGVKILWCKSDSISCFHLMLRRRIPLSTSSTTGAIWVFS